MAPARSCFVIMPIRKPGTEEYDHYKALRDTAIEPALRALNYDVVRADDVAQSGAITADLIRRLATSDLVVADLTSLNANVFYELGIRHTLRGGGTIMIVDTSRTEVPFDLKPYRVIEFTPDLRGIQKLRDMLSAYAQATGGDVPDGEKDNPVHDFLPSLPYNIWTHSEGSSEGALREEIAKLRTALKRYAGVEGVSVDELADRTDAIDVVTMVLAQARRGELPVDLIRQALGYVREQDRTGFLTALRQVLDARAGEITVNDLMELASAAEVLELPSVSIALQERAILLRPQDPVLRRTYLSRLAHSEDPRQREMARRGLLSHFGIEIDESGAVRIPPNMDPARLGTVGVMLDAFQRDGLFAESLRVTSALLEVFPDSTIVLRNHARALSSAGNRGEALQFYHAATEAPDGDSTSAVWYGSELEVQKRMVSATEAYLTACERDPDGALNFVNVADALADALRIQSIGQPNDRALPSSIDVEMVARFLQAAFSCPNVDADVVRIARMATEIAELPEALLATLVNARRSTGRPDEMDSVFLGRQDRLSLVRSLTAVLRATGPAVGTAAIPIPSMPVAPLSIPPLTAPLPPDNHGPAIPPPPY